MFHTTEFPMNNSIAPFSHTPIRRIFTAATMSVCLLQVVGCGPSQEDLIMRSAQRIRDDAEDDPPPAAIVTQDETRIVKEEPVEERDVAKSNSEPKQAEDAKSAVANAETMPSEAVGVKSIEERAPKNPLPEFRRRQMAVDNLKKISAALLAYKKDKGRFPKAYTEIGGFKTLSWRVELLPYLGYESLYEQFDFSVPWNREPNNSLQQFIPDEYVSPERFDATTNFLVPATRNFIFGKKEYLTEDYPGTILLVEANDSWAVPWTQPDDFSPTSTEELRQGLGGVRCDGAFAVWGNGWTVLLASEIPGYKLWESFRAEGSIQQPGEIHLDIAVGEVSKPSVAVSIESAPLPKVESKAEMNAFAEPVRQPIPRAGALAASQQKLREIFSEQIREATTESEKRKLSSKLLAAATSMERDPAGAYALQSAAMHLAIEGAGAKQLIAAIDHRISRFDVDPYEENITQLLAFGERVSRREPVSIQSDGFLERAVHVSHAAIVDNDFARASTLLRHAYRYLDQPRDEYIPTSVNRLRSQLSNAQQYYDRAKEQLANHRIDPSDREAAAAFGRFLCFVKGDWDNGLPLLAKGGHESLRTLAEADLNGASSDATKIALGDRWWDIASKTTTGIFQKAARDRALYWYRDACTSLPDSLDRMHVKARLDSADQEQATSPVGLVKKLAEELNVDVAISLGSVQGSGLSRGKRAGFVDRDG